MLTSITPLGERGRGQRWAVTATAYVLGSLVGGAVTGSVLGALGHLATREVPTAALLVVGAAACGTALVSDLPRPAWRLPGGRRQVDEDWLTRYRGWVYGAGFGLQLGLGFVTIVTSAATYALLVLAALSGGALPGLLVGLAFGLARALPILAVRRADSPERLRRAARVLQDREQVGACATVGVLGVVTATLAAGPVLA